MNSSHLACVLSVLFVLGFGHDVRGQFCSSTTAYSPVTSACSPVTTAYSAGSFAQTAPRRSFLANLLDPFEIFFPRQAVVVANYCPPTVQCQSPVQCCDPCTQCQSPCDPCTECQVPSISTRPAAVGGTQLAAASGVTRAHSAAPAHSAARAQSHALDSVLGLRPQGRSILVQTSMLSDSMPIYRPTSLRTTQSLPVPQKPRSGYDSTGWKSMKP